MNNLIGRGGKTAGDEQWLFVGDARGARLIQGRVGPTGRWKLTEHDQLPNRWEDEHEHGRPSGLSSGGRAGMRTGFSFASYGHAAEEASRRFVRKVADWLSEHIREEGIETLLVFAPPRFLGNLRQAVGNGVRERIVEHPVELAQVAATRLATHPKVRTALEEASKARP